MTTIQFTKHFVNGTLKGLTFADKMVFVPGGRLLLSMHKAEANQYIHRAFGGSDYTISNVRVCHG